jgi:flagellar hook-length control protein FliK
MSNPTSSIQLLGGLLSMAPSNGANGLLSQDNLGAAPASDAFYSLWVGLTQSTSLDASLANVERQASGNASQSDGSILPLELPADLLKQIESFMEDGSDNSEALDQVVSLLKESLQELFSQMDSQAPISNPNLDQKDIKPDDNIIASIVTNRPKEVAGQADDIELSDEQLLAYLKLMQQQLTQQEVVKDSGIVDQPKAEGQAAILSLLTQYLEQKLALSSEGKAPETSGLAEADQKIAELRMNQLWAQLEAARRLRDSEEPRATLSNSASDDESLVLRAQEALISGKVNEKTDDQGRLQKEALVRDELYRETLAQLIQEQNRAVVTDPQAQQNAAISERSVSPPIAPINPLSQLNNDKAADRPVEARVVLTPSAAVSGMTNNDLTPAERLAASEMMQDTGRRALTEAISQANAQRNAVDDASSDSIRRQEASATSATLIADAQKMVQSPASPAQTPIAQANNSQDALMQKMLNPAWSRALGERAVMMAQQGPRMAEVRLDPPELGSLRIRVQVHGNDQVSLTFNAPNASVREVLEQSLPRLREMFAEQGMNLADASVSDQSSEQNSEQANARDGVRGDASAREEFGELPANRTELRKVGIIDYYA